MEQKMQTKTLEQSIRFKTDPQEIYDILLSSEKFSKLTGSSARIDPYVGGRFVTFDGYIEGENIELVPGKKIVQKWRDNTWPAGHYSLVTMDLEENEKGGTNLNLRHHDIPEESYEIIHNGWKEYYWDRLK